MRQRLFVWLTADHSLVSEILRSVEALSLSQTRVDKVIVSGVISPHDQETIAYFISEKNFSFHFSPNIGINDLEAERLILVRSGSLVESGISRLASIMDTFPASSFFYADSADHNGNVFLRPAPSPIRLQAQDYLGPCIGLNLSELRQNEWFIECDFGLNPYQLALRLFHEEGCDPFVLVPHVVVSESLESNPDLQLSRSIAREELSQCGVKASLDLVSGKKSWRVRYELAEEPLVSIVIPTRGSAAMIAGKDRILIVEALRGVIDRTTYRNYEIVVVYDESTPRDVLMQLEQLCEGKLVLVPWNHAFNFSAKMNLGVLHAKGDFVLLLNDDIDLITPDWLETLLGLAMQPRVGMVGAMLYFEDQTYQHVGQIYVDGAAGHAAFGYRGGSDDNLGTLSVDREVSGVTAACALVRKDIYLAVGGMSLSFPNNYNDVDLNLKIRHLGYSSVVSPWVKLYHFESKTRDPTVTTNELDLLRGRWSSWIQSEMYSRGL